MKKITTGISVLAIFALAFTFAGGASADMDWNLLDGAAVINLSSATVGNQVGSYANTGDNELKMEAEGNRRNIVRNGQMNTGDAGSLVSLVNQVNFNDTTINQRNARISERDCGCEGANIAVVANISNAMVGNSVESGANTGNNELKMEAESEKHGEMRGHGFNLVRGGVMNTGNAVSWVEATNVVNTNITRIVQ